MATWQLQLIGRWDIQSCCIEISGPLGDMIYEEILVKSWLMKSSTLSGGYYTGCTKKKWKRSFSELCNWKALHVSPSSDKISSSVKNDTKIIKFGWGVLTVALSRPTVKCEKTGSFFFCCCWKCQMWAKNLLKFVFNGLKKHLYICVLTAFRPSFPHLET